MKKYQHSIDEQIRKAIKEGQFENLPGKGEPMDLSANPHEDPAWSVAFRAIRSSGHTLPWIEKRQQIEADLETARQNLLRAWHWYQDTQRDAGNFYQHEWKRAQDDFREKITELNKHIFNYNLEVPADQFQRRQIKVDGEIERITTSTD